MRYKKEIKYKTKDEAREIKLKLKEDETATIIWDNEKYIGVGIKLEKDVAISLASKILNFYNRDFIYSDKINKSLEKIEWKLDDIYQTMVEVDFKLDSDEMLEIKEYIEDEIKVIRG